MLESSIERASAKEAKCQGWLTFKFTSPGTAGVPDRIFIKAGRIVFIEFKQPGKHPTPLQSAVIAKMQAHGAEVYISDSTEKTMFFLKDKNSPCYPSSPVL